MANTIRLPDPQHLELDALYDAIHNAHENGYIDADELSYLYEQEPESHVFFSGDLDEAFGGDFEEAHATVMAVGERDLDDKIRYWRKEISRINEDLGGTR